MEINADFTKPAVAVPDESGWRPSPLPGVDRFMLDRIGAEVARATSIVRYAPNSGFSAHEHPLGEEFLVLEGVFSDANGDFAEGTYVRNPPGSSHAPWSAGGCTIFVKLRQFDPSDSAQLVIDTANPQGWAEGASGIATLALHRFGAERVDLIRLDEGASLEAKPPEGGCELFVVGGALANRDGPALSPWSWLRLPPGQAPRLTALAPSLLYRKTGHLGG